MSGDFYCKFLASSGRMNEARNLPRKKHRNFFYFEKGLDISQKKVYYINIRRNVKMNINEPMNAFRDFDTIVKIIGDMQDNVIRTVPMTKEGQAIRCAGFMSTVRVTSPEYSMMLYFSLSGMNIEEFGYGFIPRTLIRNTDIVGFETEGHKATFILREGSAEKYKLSEDRIVLDFDDLRNSTKELLNTEKAEHFYRILPDAFRLHRGFAEPVSSEDSQYVEIYDEEQPVEDYETPEGYEDVEAEEDELDDLIEEDLPEDEIKAFFQNDDEDEE